MLTTELTAWATTAATMPEADAGITITAAEITTEPGGRHIEERGEIATSDPQPDDWGIIDGGGFDRDAADKLLDEMGYRRIGDWQGSDMAYATHVEAV